MVNVTFVPMVAEAVFTDTETILRSWRATFTVRLSVWVMLPACAVSRIV